MSRVALVTGAAGGVGRACARMFASRGETLLLTDLAGAALGTVAGELRADGAEVSICAGEIGDPAVVDELIGLVREAGGLRALAHAAGLSPTMADAERIFRVNLEASARLVDALHPFVHEGSAAVLVASQAGVMAAASARPAIDALLDEAGGADWYPRIAAEAGAGLAGHPGGAYALSKRGVQRLAVSRAPAWGARGARILSLSPGIVDTEMGQQEYAQQPAMKAIVEATPVGQRMARPEEIAAVVGFLCSPEASFMTGVDVLVDGGSTYQVMGGLR